MKKTFFFLFFLFFLSGELLAAASLKYKVEAPYSINNFEARISLNQDTSLTVEERIETYFNQEKHGIFRVIPVIYSFKGRTIRTKLEVLSVTDENKIPVPFKISKYGQSLKIQIGDPEKTITGEQVYLIKYQVNRVVQRYEDYDQIYWNLTGSEWDVAIEKASAKVFSLYAKIKKTDCFSGLFGTREKYCQSDFSDQEADFFSLEPVGKGKDLTLVVGLDKNNRLEFPGIWQELIWGLADNWGYLATVIPFLIIFLAWFLKGRDEQYLSAGVYYQPDDQRTKKVSPFSRPHLPLVYHPIDDLTPAEVGTTADEKVDIEDVVAEIIELARLGHLKIKRIEEKKILGRKTDYLFLRQDKNTDKLRDYQKSILEAIFRAGLTGKDLEKLFKLGVPKDAKAVLLSQLKNKFHQDLEEIKNKLYQSLAEKKIFSGRPDKVRTAWFGLAIILVFLSLFPIIFYISQTGNSGPLILFFPISVITLIIPKFMPRKTAWGYSLHRQTRGLKWYLGKGKWREEIHEKHLFLEEMLPLAISLGVVGQLTKDMAQLGVKPPEYFQGVRISHLSQDLGSFQARAASNLSSSPSGKSSWSGGSGFSGGGFSGGGFGGGGGGSW